METLGRRGRWLRRRAPADAPQVLITGAAGLIGSVLRSGLGERYRLRGLDARPGKGVDVIADMTDPAAIAGAFEGMDAVVDLAGDSDADASWDVVYDNNMPAALNALEEARRAGVKRFVYASSNHVTGMYERDEPYASIVAGRYDRVPDDFERLSSATPVRPDGAYGVGKAFAEAAARYFAEEYGLAAICLRIGTVNRPGRPQNVRHFATLLTHRDLVHLVDRCVAAPEAVRFGIFYGVSANTRRFWDIEEARNAIGYEPRDDAERWR
jgi:nucleoside-diphosphate-sugar epimerase